MTLKSFGAKIFAKHVVAKINAWSNNPVKTQERVLQTLLKQARDTQFGKDHLFSEIYTHENFADKVPIRDYEALRNYVDRVVKGESDILWPGKPLYLSLIHI